MSRVYMVVGGLVLVSYLGVTVRGVIFSGTDEVPSYSMRSGGGRRPGGGFFWGVGGYRGGK